MANVALSSIYQFLDARADNLGNARVGGWDYSFQFTQPADWGSVFAAVSGSFMTLNESQTLPGQPYVSNISIGLSNTGAFNLGRSLHRMSVRTGFWPPVHGRDNQFFYGTRALRFRRTPA